MKGGRGEGGKGREGKGRGEGEGERERERENERVKGRWSEDWWTGVDISGYLPSLASKGSWFCMCVCMYKPSKPISGHQFVTN